MKKILKKSISIMLTALLLLTAAPPAGFVGLEQAAQAAEVIISGNCGTNVTYVLDRDGTLTISGTGAMTYYYSYSSVPWYSNRESIKEAVIKDSVTSIGDFAFGNCTALTSLTIGDNVMRIGDFAFDNCISLTSVTIGDSVTSIGYETFADCTSLTEVNIPGSVTSIYSAAFFACDSLTSITIGDSVTHIGDDAFALTAYYNDKSNWEDNVLYIGKYLIEAKTDLSSSCTIKEGTRIIADYAFYDCTSLTEVNIPNSVTSIGSSAFRYCTGLTDVYYTGSEEEWNAVAIGDNNDPLLNANIHFNCNEHTYTDGICTGCGAIEIIDSGTCGKNLTWTLDAVGTLTISGTGDMTDYSSPNQPWYSYRSSIKNVIIEDGVTSIGKYAFSWCDLLRSVTIPDSVTSIGSYAFNYCTGLPSVTIPDSVTNIGTSAFDSCRSLLSVIIPKSVTTIGDDAFYNCTSLAAISVDADNASYSSDENGVLFNKDKTTLIQYPAGNATASYAIPDSATSIDSAAFSGCHNLASITIPDSITKIKDSAFANCYSLTSITIPAGVTSIGYNAFRICKSLTEIIVDADNANYCSDEYGVLFNKDKTTIIRYPEGNARKGYVIPDCVTSIEDCAFDSCHALTSITIPDSVTSIGSYAFYDCDSLTAITIPDSVTKIEYAAFILCESLTSITIPASVTSIGSNAFSHCTSLTSIIIPASVTSIGNYAFSSCSMLTDVYYTGSEEEWNAVAIGNSNDPLLNATIHFNYHEHTYNTVVTAPTCTEKGYTTYTCSICGDNYVADYVPVLGHNYNSVVTAPTCTEQGYTTYTCSVCGDDYIADEVPAIEHSYTAEITTPATHLQTGLRTYTCTCGDSYTEVIDKITAHEYNANITPPTCLDRGFTVYVCACGDSYVADYVPATGHADENADALCDACGISLLGDLDGDKQITSSDARLALRASVGLETLTDAQAAAADADGNGEITSFDARCILRAAVGLDDPADWKTLA